MLTDLGPNTLEIRRPWQVARDRSRMASNGAKWLAFRARERHDPGPGPVPRVAPRGRHRRVEFVVRVVVLTCMLALMVPTLARAEHYHSERAGHPLRIVAYVLHPVGVILDTLIFKPAWSLAQYEPLRTLVGMQKPAADIAPAARASANPFLEPYYEEP